MIHPHTKWTLRPRPRDCFRWREVVVLETTDATFKGKVLVDPTGDGPRCVAGCGGPAGPMVFDLDEFRAEYEPVQRELF